MTEEPENDPLEDAADTLDTNNSDDAPSSNEANEDLVETTAELTVEEQLVQAQATIDEKHNDWMRALADLQNARRNSDTNLRNARTNITGDVVSELLPVLDDITLAIANIPEEVAATEWFGGFSLIPKKFSTTLEKLNVHQIESVGAEFDPEKHNAIMREASEEYDSNIVIKEYQPGYRLGDRVIRPAVVAVAE